jgi:uncharacterized iron-regulated membrane protein
VIVARAQAHSLGHVERIRVPQAHGDIWRRLLRSHPTRLIGNPRIEAMFDPGSGELLVERSDRTRTAGETFMHGLFPLRSGTTFGGPGMLAMCITGVAPMLLVVTGLWVWLRKPHGERVAEERRREQRRSARPAVPSGSALMAVPAHANRDAVHWPISTGHG